MRPPTDPRPPSAPEPVSARSVLAGLLVSAALVAVVWLRHHPIAGLVGVLALAALLVVARRLAARARECRDHRVSIGLPGGGRLVVRLDADQ